MKNLERVRALTDFLRAGSPTLEAIMRFVALDTLYELSAITLFLNVVRSDGTVHIPVGFGYPQQAFEKIPERSIGVDTPVNKALRTGQITKCGNYQEYLFAGPDYAEQMFPNGFASSMAWPVPDVGVIVTFCSAKVEITQAVEEFLLAIGGILSMQLSQPQYRAKLGIHGTHKDPVTAVALTPRQWIVLGAIKRGLTNPVIAKELEFSESLIRQETVQIYRKLGVSGRKELLESPELSQ